MSEGIIIIPMGGKKYIEQTHANLRAIRRISDLPVTLFTNEPDEFQGNGFFYRSLEEIATENPRGTIQVCECVDHGGVKNQTHYVTLSPYQKTIHLDCDAIPVHETAFEPLLLLGRYDLALSLEFARPFRGQRQDLPAAFVQWNCGVMFYNREMIPIFKAWNRGFKAGQKNTQRSLVGLIWDHPEIKVYTLAHEWNYKGAGLCASKPNPSGKVRIAHSHDIAPMIDAEGRLDERAFQEWFFGRTIRRLREECRVIVLPNFIRRVLLKLRGLFPKKKKARGK